ncbi:glycosyltransferase family 2 protein [Desulfosporosinus nitroreducens]|uniref:Glycosyltransferase n=1 Tax=Desulfosporosinus nitroreducens TaxID=2018668 RepID=A0ABT8QWG6_9FIRM|nr:glycosyltransferase family 2 protein [Desulfosporosinus nitroreducens]MDO0824924.1 glycosyltransferase [Desulfosporosinus nitroreducens]
MNKLSVVVPVYNVENYIGECIESLQEQIIKEIEIILVDDGSPDRSGTICDEYAAKDERIKVIHKKNGGVGAARNDGLNAATGDWIVFCDSDDWVERDAFEKLIGKGEAVKADVVFGDANLVYGNKVQQTQFYKDEFVTSDRTLIDQLIAADFSRTYCYNPPAAGPAFGYGGPWNKLVRRKMLLDNNIRFDNRVKGIFDDILYTAYIFAAANTVAYMHVPVYNYRQLGSSITRSYKANLLEINDAIFNAWQEFIERYGENGQFIQPYYANVIRRFKSTLGLYFFSEKNQKSFHDQLQELKALMGREPYSTAIRNVDANRLHNKYDKLIWQSAKGQSGLMVYLIYQLSLVIKKVREKNH